MKLTNLPNIEFKVMIIKMLNKLRGEWVNSENFNKEIENIRKYQT